MFKKLPFKRREASKEKETLAKEQFNNKRIPLNLKRVQQFRKKRNDSSISKEIEEAGGSLRKRILSARSESIGEKKRKTLKMIEDQYKIIKKKNEKEPNKDQKMRQPQFDQLCCNSRESFKPKEQNISKNRFIRVKSNDSFSKFITNKKVQQQNIKKIDSLKQQNIYLKQMHIHSLKRIEIYQQQKVNEKNKFEIEKTSYERQMETLRGKIDRNKVDIGHLFSYQSFDPAKLVVRPIIEVEQNSSIMRPIYSSNKHSENKKMELETQYGNSGNWSKKIPTETTAINSLQQIRDIIDLF